MTFDRIIICKRRITQMQEAERVNTVFIFFSYQLHWTLIFLQFFQNWVLCGGNCQKRFLSGTNWLLLKSLNLGFYFNSRVCSTLGIFENYFCNLPVTGKNVFFRLSPSLVKNCLKIDPTVGQMCLFLRYGLPDFHVEYFKPRRENDLYRASSSWVFNTHSLKL